MCVAVLVIWLIAAAAEAVFSVSAAEARPLFVLQDSLPRIKSFVARKLFPHAAPQAVTLGLPSAASLLHPSPVVA